MSYTNPNQTADYTLSEGTIVGSTIANSTAATGDVYAKNLTVDNAAVVMSNTTIDAGGYINATAGANFKNMTVLSGGTFNRTAGVYLSGLTAASGAVLNNVLGGAIKWQGTWNIQSGAKIGGFTNIYTDTDGYLNMNGRGMAGAIYCYINVKNININSYLYLYGHVSGGTVASRSDNGDALRMYGNAYAEDIHVLSGGSVRFYGVSATLRDLVADSGAKITLTANNWLAGRKTTFAKGFISNSNLEDVYAQDGVIYNWTTPADFGAFYFADITLQDGDATGQYVYLGTGAETRNFTVTGAAGKLTGIVLGQAGNGAAIDTTATDAGGGITVHSSYLAVFGGTNNNVTAGHILIGPAAACVANPDLSIIDDKFNGIELKANTTKEYMTKIKLVSGLSAVNPIVSSGGTLYLESGGSAVGGTVYAGGVLQALKGGTISGATVSGYLHVMDFNLASETASANRPAAFANDVDLLAGQLFLRGSNASGANLRVSGGIFYLQNGGSASKVTVTGGTLSAYRNAGIHPDDTPTTIHLDDLTMTGGSTYLYNTVQATNATITGGSMTIRGTARVSGATLTGGSVTMSGGVLSGASLSNAGKVTVSNGGSALNVNITGGATYQLLVVSAGGYAANVNLVGGAGSTANTNYVYTYGTGVIENITIDAGSLYQAMGGTVRNLTVRNAAVPVARGVSAYISGATVSGGYLHFQNGAKGQDVVVTGGTLYVHDDGPGGGGTGAYVSNVDLATGTVNVYAGGNIRNMRTSGGTVNVTFTSNYGAVGIADVTMTGGTVNLNNNTTADDLTVNAGKLNIAAGATVNGLTVNETATSGGISVRGRVNDLVMSGATLTTEALYLYAGGAISGGMLYGKHQINHIYMVGGEINDFDVVNGNIYQLAGGEITNLRQSGGQVIARGSGAIVSGAVVIKGEGQNGGEFYAQNGASAFAVTAKDGGKIYAYMGTAFAHGTDLNPTIFDADISAGGSGIVEGGGIFDGVRVHEGGSATVGNSGSMIVRDSAWNVTVNNGGVVNLDLNETLINAQTKTGAHVNFVDNKSAAAIAGADTNIAASTFYYNGATVGLGFTATNGVVRNLGADGNLYRIAIGDGITVEDAEVQANCRISAFGGAVVSGVNIVATTTSASVIMRDDSEVYNATLTGGTYKAVINVYENAKAEGVTINAGGKVGVSGAAKIEDTTIKAGGQLVISAGCPDVDTGDRLTLDFTGTTGNQSVSINDLGSINAKTEIMLVGETAGNTYTIADTGSTEKYVNCGEWGLYDDRIKAGESIIDAFTGFSYEFNAAGTQITVGTVTMTDLSSATTIEDGTVLADGGRAAKWTANTTTGGSGSVIKAATSAVTGGAWLEIDGTNLSGTTLFGAETGFSGGVNVYATGDATVGNLAAGAEAGGTVESVKLTVDSSTVGLAYAGGFGNVTSATETLIGEGATLTKDFYAGALANYAKTGATTSAGDIALAIAGGEFSGNIYGAASVKAGAATSVVHSVGNVTIDVTGGATTKGAQACLFAGGYATGSTTNKVYTVTSVTTTISGGSWGSAAGGRGVFGGIFASNVTAEAGDVSITIDGGSFGNVFGGGWAQKGGTSIVGDVNLTITGGTIANVFGGGSHSTSGGTTVAGNVSITVAGGTITGAIYACGQADGDVVSGDEVSVTFSGDTNFGCGVYGYSYVGGAASDAVLNFTAYTGTFSGKLGGFANIAFDDDTAMTLTTAAADVSNGKWEFDFTDRDAELAGTSLLTWSGANFEDDSVKVNFTDATQAAAGWSIATAAFDATTTFDLYIGGSNIAEKVAYDTAIADGDWAGWKFTSVGGTLKFAKLA